MTARKLAVEAVRAMGQSQALAVSAQSLATHAGLTVELVIAGVAPDKLTSRWRPIKTWSTFRTFLPKLQRVLIELAPLRRDSCGRRCHFATWW